MNRLAIAALGLLVLSACREEEAAALPPPVAVTEATVDHFSRMNMFEQSGARAQVHLDGLPNPLFFAQVRDAMAYIRMPEQSDTIRAVYVTDMGAATNWQDPGTESWIAAEVAHYVVGAAVPGATGAPDLVPFADASAAAVFAAEHGGGVVSLNQIEDADVLAPLAIGDTTDDDDRAYRERLRALTAEQEG